MRITLSLTRVLRVFIDNPSEKLWGFDLGKRSKLPSGTIYPLLARLERNGWVVADWEEIDESKEGRRKRRYYQLTELGSREAEKVLEKTRNWLFSVMPAKKEVNA